MANSQLDEILAALEPYKDSLSSITVGDIIDMINEVSDADWASVLATAQSYVDLVGSSSGVDVPTYTTKEQVIAFYSKYPNSMSLYDMIVEEISAGLSGSGGSGGHDSGETIPGTDGNDTLSGGTGSDTITGGAGDDTIAAGDGKDVIYGGDGNDDIDAGTGNDSVFGGAGNDTLDGGTGADRMEGSSGADTYIVDNKKDSAYEADNDPEDGSGLVLDADLGNTIDSVISSVKYTLGNFIENLTLAESTAKLAGTGNTLGNEIVGNSGANKISGMAGDDTLDGGAGADKLAGGAGADTFCFGNLASGGADTISDFADEDTLEFDTTVFTSLAGATAGNFVAGSAAQEADDFLIYDNGKLYYDADGSGAGKAILIAGIKGTDAKTLNFDDLSFV